MSLAEGKPFRPESRNRGGDSSISNDPSISLIKVNQSCVERDSRSINEKMQEFINHTERNIIRYPRRADSVK